MRAPRSLSEGARAALVLAAACTAAKLASAGVASFSSSPWAPLALLAPDALLALLALPLFLALYACGRGGRALALVAQFAAVAWTALAVPVARTLGSPPTRAMLGAAGAPLRDSLVEHFRLANLAWIAAIGLAALLAARALRASSPRLLVGAFAALALLALIGRSLTAPLALRGLERNALLVLLSPTPELAGSMQRDPREALAAARAFAPRALSEGALSWRGACRDASLVVVVLESAAARALGAYGAPVDALPRISALARAGLRVDAAYAAYPESIRGLVALFFGLHPAPGLAAEDYAQLRAASLADELRALGAATALVHAGWFDYLGMRSIVEAAGFDVALDAGAIGGESAASFGVPEERAVERALQWVEGLSPAQRFALVYLPIAGHHPYAAPPGGPFEAKDEREAWGNALHYADREVARLWEGLCARRGERPLLLAVVGDHGQAFGEHPRNVGHSFFLYEENLRVPLCFAVAGLDLPAAEIPGVASHVDLLPTLLDLLGAEERASAMDGRSLLREQEGAALFFADYGLPLIGLREGRWKWIQELSSGRSELYDLVLDPGEQQDLGAAEPARCADFARRSRAWWGAQRERLRSLGSASSTR
ncbi:MAG: sulfatase-like hydrolase/transferase [Planctomycetes bacterium]|nr:sulfatase-like hydrolase/transferase [Planctomycetota bacterium]